MTSSSEKFFLKWNDFQTNITSSLHGMREDANFSDITLVCEDNLHIEAHRVILAASSPYFGAMLRKNTHPHPMVHMKGNTAKDISSILDFVYHGEASVYQEDLDNFFGLAEDLKLKGLSRNNAQEVEHTQNIVIKHDRKVLKRNHEALIDSVQVPGPLQKHITQSNREEEQYKIVCLEDSPASEPMFDMYSEDIGEQNIPVENMSESHDMIQITHIPRQVVTEQYDEDINAMMQKVEGSRQWRCNICGDISRDKTHMRNHIEGVHTKGLSEPIFDMYSDDMVEQHIPSHIAVENVYETQEMIQIAHNPVEVVTDKYSEEINSMMQKVEGSRQWRCNICGKISRDKTHMRNHIEGVHIEGLSYRCTICEKKLRSRNSLGNHMSKFHKNCRSA